MIPGPSGQPELALLHRPLFPGTRPEEIACNPEAREVDIDRKSIWISYCQMTIDRRLFRTGKFTFHHRLAFPVSPWERLKIGGGTPPHVDILWTDKELESLAELASGQPAEPTDALIRAMRQ